MLCLVCETVRHGVRLISRIKDISPQCTEFQPSVLVSHRLVKPGDLRRVGWTSELPDHPVTSSVKIPSPGPRLSVLGECVGCGGGLPGTRDSGESDWSDR